MGAKKKKSVLPSNIKFGPFDIALRVDGLATAQMGGALGITMWEGATILVKPGLPDILKKEVVLHEVLHGIIAVSNIQGPLRSNDNEEQVVAILAPWLLAVLRDNPRLVEFLTCG